MLVAWYMLMVVWTFIVLILAGDGMLDWADLWEILDPFPMESDSIFFIWIPVGLIVLVQFAMLLPAAHPMRRSGRPRSLWFSGIVGGLLAALLFVGVLVALTDLPRVAVVFGFTVTDGIRPARGVGSSRVEAIWRYVPYFGLLVLLGSWAFWTIVLLRSLQETPGGWLARMIRWLIAGSLIELAITLPLYVIVRRRYDCWCSLPSYWAVASGIMALLSLTGPGVVLLWRRRRGLPTDAWVDRCMICGYRRADDAGARCPECGTRWGRMVRAGGNKTPDS